MKKILIISLFFLLFCLFLVSALTPDYSYSKVNKEDATKYGGFGVYFSYIFMILGGVIIGLVAIGWLLKIAGVDNLFVSMGVWIGHVINFIRTLFSTMIGAAPGVVKIIFFVLLFGTIGSFVYSWTAGLTVACSESGEIYTGTVFDGVIVKLLPNQVPSPRDAQHVDPVVFSAKDVYILGGPLGGPLMSRVFFAVEGGGLSNYSVSGLFDGEYVLVPFGRVDYTITYQHPLEFNICRKNLFWWNSAECYLSNSAGSCDGTIINYNINQLRYLYRESIINGNITGGILANIEPGIGQLSKCAKSSDSNQTSDYICIGDECGYVTGGMRIKFKYTTDRFGFGYLYPAEASGYAPSALQPAPYTVTDGSGNTTTTSEVDEEELLLDRARTKNYFIENFMINEGKNYKNGLISYECNCKDSIKKKTCSGYDEDEVIKVAGIPILSFNFILFLCFAVVCFWVMSFKK